MQYLSPPLRKILFKHKQELQYKPHFEKEGGILVYTCPLFRHATNSRQLRSLNLICRCSIILLLYDRSLTMTAFSFLCLSTYLFFLSIHAVNTNMNVLSNWWIDFVYIMLTGSQLLDIMFQFKIILLVSFSFVFSSFILFSGLNKLFQIFVKDFSETMQNWIERKAMIRNRYNYLTSSVQGTRGKEGHT